MIRLRRRRIQECELDEQVSAILSRILSRLTDIYVRSFVEQRFGSIGLRSHESFAVKLILREVSCLPGIEAFDLNARQRFF